MDFGGTAAYLLEILLRWYSDPVVLALWSILVGTVLFFFVIRKRASLEQGGKILRIVRNKATNRLRRFSLAADAKYATQWDSVQCQPIMLMRWLQDSSPKEWHRWIEKRAFREISDFLSKCSEDEEVAWKLEVTGFLKGSVMPAISDVEIRFESADFRVMIITCNITYSSQDRVPPLGVFLKCTSPSSDGGDELMALVTIHRLEAKMVAHINPYLDSSFENEADSDTMPEFAYRLETEKCRKFQITTELLSGKPLDKQSEIELKSLITSSCDKFAHQCSLHLTPPPPSITKYSSIPGQGASAESPDTNLNKSLSSSRLSLSQPVGGGMSIDLLPRQLIVEVVEGYRLCRKGKDHSDAFCVVELDGPDQKPQQTTVVKKSYSPEWNEALVFDLGDECTQLTVSVFHYDVIRKNEFLGRAHLSLNHVRDEKPLTKTLFLSGRSTDNEQEVVMGNITLRAQRKLIPQLSKIKRHKSAANVSTRGIKDLKNHLSNYGSLEYPLSRTASSPSVDTKSAPTSPQRETAPELPSAGLAIDPVKVRAESPAIMISAPSETEDEAITEIQEYRPRHHHHPLTSEDPVVEDDADVLDGPGETNVNGAEESLRPRTSSFDHRHLEDRLMEPDRLSSVSGVSDSQNPFSTLVIETADDPPSHYLIPASSGKRAMSMTGTKLHIYNNHVFVATHFSRQESPRCNVCEKELGGFGKQGYRCRDCLLVAHKKCHTSVEEPCPVSSVSSMRLLYHWETPL